MGRGADDAAPGLTEATCKQPRGVDPSWPSLSKEGTYRSPTAGISFSGVAMNWYPNQGSRPLETTRGHPMDHVGLSVTDLDAWWPSSNARASLSWKRPMSWATPAPL